MFNITFMYRRDQFNTNTHCEQLVTISRKRKRNDVIYSFASELGKKRERSRKNVLRACVLADLSSPYVLGASWRSGGAGLGGVWPSERVSSRGGGAHQGETAETERGKTQHAGGGAHSSDRANQPTGKYSRPASHQTEGGGKPRAAQGKK